MPHTHLQGSKWFNVAHFQGLISYWVFGDFLIIAGNTKVQTLTVFGTQYSSYPTAHFSDKNLYQ